MGYYLMPAAGGKPSPGIIAEQLGVPLLKAPSGSPRFCTNAKDCRVGDMVPLHTWPPHLQGAPVICMDPGFGKKSPADVTWDDVMNAEVMQPWEFHLSHLPAWYVRVK